MKKGKMFLMILIILAIGGAGAMFFLQKGEAEAGAEKPVSAEELTELSIDTDIITTNLASAEHFGVVQFNILMSDKKAKEEIATRTAEVRAAIILTVAGFTKDELVGTEGITSLEAALSLKLDDIIEAGKVDRVLVTELKVQ